MWIIEFSPLIEMLVCNLITMHLCCTPKYSLRKNLLVLVPFSVLFVSCAFFLQELFPFNGQSFLFGFLYMIPFCFLYREKPSRLFVIMCMCWIYTMGIFSFTLQLTGLFTGTFDPFPVLMIQSILLLATIFPFYKKTLPKYIFMLQNASLFGTRWNKYLVIKSVINFLCISLLNMVFLQPPFTLSRILVLSLILTSIHTSYFILCRMAEDSIKITHLERDVLYDSLTGIGNRTLLMNRLHLRLSEDQPFSLLFLDLDKFKLINDTYGHITGDDYLRHFSAICTRLFQNSGEVYRYGGDEFAVLYNGILPQEEIDRYKDPKIWEQIWADGAPCPFNGVSLGCLVCKAPHQDAETVLAQVDRIMYHNKADKLSGTYSRQASSVHGQI